MVAVMRIAIALVFAFGLAACGSDSKAKNDSPTHGVATAIACPPSPDATITVNSAGTAYVPSTVSIPPGGIVRFVITASHNVTSTTPGLAVDFGQTACLGFLDPGTYSFHCSVHGFQGTVTVQ
jgi:plastocyanin